MHISQITREIKYNFIQKQKGDIIAFLDHNWKNIVTNKEESYPEKILFQKLYIQCKNNAEKFLLFNQQKILISKINDLFPEKIITKIIFK